MKKATLFFTVFLLALQAKVVGQCNTPNNLRAEAYGSNFIDLNWDNTTASSFEIRYVVQGGSVTTAPITTVSSRPYRVSGLNPNTTYSFQVREVCTNAAWANTTNLSTSCNVVTPPFTANFNGPAWTVGTFSTAGTINSCWQRTPTTGYIWKPGPPSFVNSLTGASQDVSGSGKYMYIDDINFNFGSKDSTQFYSPLFDISALSSPRLRFFYHMYGSDIEELRVFISNDFGASYTSLLTLSGQKQFSNSDAWKEQIIDLSTYANDTVRLLFEVFEQSIGTRNAVCIDNVTIENTPSCPKPQNFQVLSTRTTSATLDWQTGGSSNWQISYGSPNFSPANGTIISTSSKPFTISGLTANTNYQAYVRDSCAANDQSVWVGPISFKTTCNPISTPYTENFDANGFLASTTFNGRGSINSCWDRDNSANYDWKPGPPQFAPTNTGPSGDHTTGNGQYMYAETFSTFGNDTTYLTSPPIDLGGLTSPQLTYFVHLYGSTINSLETYVDAGSGFTLVNTQNGQQQSSKNAAWKEIIVDLSAYQNDTIRIQFIAERTTNGFASDIAIDDISIDEAPSCPKPQNFSIVSLSSTSAVLGWQSGGATNWNLSYGAPGTAAGAGTIVNTSTNPTTITGLTASTTYDIFVRDSCGPGDVSVWVGPIQFTTLCNAVSAPYFENFDGTDFSPGIGLSDPGTLNSCWRRTDTAINYQWATEDGPTGIFNSGPSADHTTGNGQFIYSKPLFNFTLVQSTESEVISPSIDLSALSVPEMRFWYHMYGAAIDSLAVYVDAGQGFLHQWSISGQQQTSSTAAWQEAIVDISSFSNSTISIKFVAYRNSAFGTQSPICIDDLRVDEQPNCPQPSNFTASNISGNSVTFNWTSGGATNWQIEYGPPGFSLGNGTLVNVSSNPFTLTGLNSNTGYTFYLRDSCGVADVSFWTPGLSLRTACTVISAPYFEDFENNLWIDAVGFNDPGRIDPCWNRSDTTSFFFRGNLGASDGFQTGPSGDHTTGSGKYAYAIRAFGFNNNLETDLETPLISLDTLSNPQLRFWYHMYGSDIDKLQTFINNGSGWTSINSISGQQQTSGTAAWQEQIISLSNYVGDTVKFRFRASRTTTFASRVSSAIDDIRVDNVPTCPAPTNLSGTSPNPNSITLSWNTGGASNWLIRFRPAGSNQPYTIVSANSNPFTINGLNPNSSYEFYVKDSCSAGDVSWWAGPQFASTACGISGLPYSEGFEGNDWVSGTGFFNTGDQIANCWSRNRANDNDKWGTRTGATPSFSTGPIGAASGTKYVYYEADFGTINNQAILTSPEIALLNTSSPQLLYRYHMFGSNIGSLQVRINTRNNGNGIVLRTWNGQQQTTNIAAWKLDSIDLSAYVGDTIEIVFRATAGTNFGGNGDIAVDDVEVKASGPSCGRPVNLQTTNVTYNSLSFSWANTNLGSSSTNLRWYEAAAGPATATLVNGVTSPYTINGLSPSTDYVVELFDSCGTIASSVYSDTLSTLFCDSVSASFTLNGRFFNRQFTSSTTNNDTLYWYFGDGDSSSATNPFHRYTSPGTYTVQLIALNECGNGDTATQTINVCDTLFANFTWVRTADSTVYTADPNNNALGFSWDLDDGLSGSGPRVSVQYSTNTDKTVTLTTWNACGDTVRNTRTVKACDPPVADWTYTILNPINSGLRVQFDGTLSRNAVSYSWDFGDGNSATGPTPIHIYNTPGLFYQVELTVTNICGAISKRKFRLNQIGLDEPSFNKVAVYPNPVVDKFRVEWPEDLPDFDRIRVVDSRGAEVKHWQQSQADYSLGNLPNGLYMIVIESPLGRKQFPLIKK